MVDIIQIILYYGEYGGSPELTHHDSAQLTIRPVQMTGHPIYSQWLWLVNVKLEQITNNKNKKSSQKP